MSEAALLDAAGNPRQTSYDRDDIKRMVTGAFMGPGNAQLPDSPILMIHRITEVTADGGEFDGGRIVSEFDLNAGDVDWFFKCHFIGNPVMPGSMGYEGMMQTLGFFGCWAGLTGRGYAQETGKTTYKDMIRPTDDRLRFICEISKVINREKIKAVKGVARMEVYRDGEWLLATTMEESRVFYEQIAT